jgi:hypothetical protein
LVASFLAANLYQGNHDRNKPDLEYCINCEIYTPYAGAAGMLLHKKLKVRDGKIEIISFIVKFCS